MAKGKKTGGRNFEAGHNVGRPQLPGDIKGARQLNQIELERMLNDLIYKTPKELQHILDSNQSSALEGIVAKVIIEAGRTGDQFRLDFLLNRLVGKVTEKVQHSGKLTLAELVDASRDKDEN